MLDFIPVLADTNSFPVTIHVHAGQSLGPLTPTWRFFGYDEADYTYLKDGKKLLSELGDLEGPQVFIRCHHLLTSGDGAYSSEVQFHQRLQGGCEWESGL